MKIRKNIFSSLHLILFVSSLMFSVFHFFNADVQASTLDHKEHHFVDNKGVEDGNGSQLVFEENENEKNENVLQCVTLVVPAFISFFQFEIFGSTPVGFHPETTIPAKPIYLAICNFRV